MSCRPQGVPEEGGVIYFVHGEAIERETQREFHRRMRRGGGLKFLTRGGGAGRNMRTVPFCDGISLSN